jgi:hypothetical protein
MPTGIYRVHRVPIGVWAQMSDKGAANQRLASARLRRMTALQHRLSRFVMPSLEDNLTSATVHIRMTARRFNGERRE